MRLKRCRLFNSAYLFKDIWGENRDLFIFPLFLFYPHFPTTWCFHFIYFKCCQRGMCFFSFVVYIYKNDGVLKKKNLWLFVENKSWTLSWCICKTTMYVQYACKCRCPGVATVHLTLRTQLQSSLLPSKPEPMANWRNLLIVSNVEIITNI